MLEPTASLARLLSDWAWAEHNSKAETGNPRIADRAREAERLLRDVLARRMSKTNDSWRIGDVKSRLGGALVCVAVTDSTLDAEGREAKFSEAESLLLDGYECLQNRSNDPKYEGDARRRIDRLYQVWNKPARRAEWQQKQIASLGRAAEKGNVTALNDLAWLLATCSDAGIRDGRKAVTFAEKAVAMTNRKDPTLPTLLDTLAAAHAEAGEFAKAIDVQTEAVNRVYDEKEKKGFASRLRLYQSNTPHREP